MVTIKDLAKYCHYSVTTVSYALNDSDEIPEETKEKILKAAEELNYVPSAYARGLKKRKTYNIGVYIPDFGGPVRHVILSGLVEGFKENDSRYNMIVLLPDDKMTFIRERRLDLAIITDPKIPDNTIKELSGIMPVVLMDNNINGDNCYEIDVNNEEGVYNLTKELIERGSKRIAYLYGSHASYHNMLRFKGYKKALIESGINPDEMVFFDADSFTEEAGYETVKKALNSQKKDFDTLMCGNDELAIGAIKALQELGYNVPKDIKVTGFDNIDKGTLINPSLSTITVDWFLFGKEMAKYSLDVLARKNVDNTVFLKTAKIIWRDSTKNI
ncbi:MAG: LacI family DNA-binding transcriptional regulator [Bacilli bacterium]|nr:LacI family DNA-binding transcriptional regulator [Bacilli bacterium]